MRNKHTHKVCHLTSVHPRYDTRIFLKMCSSLAKKYYVSLIVADGAGAEKKDNITIYDVGPSKNRLMRIFTAPNRVFKKAVRIDADLYHLHDPELIPIGLKLKRLGKKVFFDAHEDAPEQMLSKYYLNYYSRRVISKLLKTYENYAFPKFDGLITATPFIKNKLIKLNANTTNINNYPIVGELSHSDSKSKMRSNSICYIGNIDTIRGINELVKSLEFVDEKIELKLAGHYSSNNIRSSLKELPGWSNIKEYGLVSRRDVANIFNQCFAGIVTFHDYPNHRNAQPNKMFEYMSAGLPVIASDFPLWRRILNDNSCGILVDPKDPEDIARAINYLFLNQEKAKEMGVNGRKAVLEKYNWYNESKKLFQFYKKTLKD